MPQRLQRCRIDCQLPGTSKAGSKCGKSETIARGGWGQSWKKPEWCRRCADSKVYREMYSEANGQHLGPRYDALSALTWYETLLIARVHPVMSVVTMAATGLLCYAGHVCNYYVKTLEWFRGLPAILKDRRWFLIKRRKSIRAPTGDTRQKKPTTANRTRLEKGMKEAMRRMPNVYKGSVILEADMAKFPVEGEQEMLEQTDSVELRGSVRLTRELFCAWLGESNRDDAHAEATFPCAAALMLFARNKQGVDMRGDVSADTAWELCGRHMHDDAQTAATVGDARATIGTEELAALLVFLLRSNNLSEDLRTRLFEGMLADLAQREREVRTENDEMEMEARWVKLRIHGELEAAREQLTQRGEDLDFDLTDIHCAMMDGEAPSLIQETEAEAAMLVKRLEAEAVTTQAGAAEFDEDGEDDEDGSHAERGDDEAEREEWAAGQWDDVGEESDEDDVSEEGACAQQSHSEHGSKNHGERLEWNCGACA